MLGNEFGERVFLPFFIFSQSPFSGEKVRCLDITCPVDSVVLPSSQLPGPGDLDGSLACPVGNPLWKDVQVGYGASDVKSAK